MTFQQTFFIYMVLESFLKKYLFSWKKENVKKWCHKEDHPFCSRKKARTALETGTTKQLGHCHNGCNCTEHMKIPLSEEMDAKEDIFIKRFWDQYNRWWSKYCMNKSVKDSIVYCIIFKSITFNYQAYNRLLLFAEYFLFFFLLIHLTVYISNINLLKYVKMLE